jgi:predicted membrane GTPase involved in stress response
MQAASSATVVVVAYRPKPGKGDELLQLTREHLPLLRREGLATDRPVVAARAEDGTIVEVFEWAPGGVEKAHTNPVVGKLWGRYAAACDIVPLNQLAESSTMFASFTPLDLD